jgi:hypothetical protein
MFSIFPRYYSQNLKEHVHVVCACCFRRNVSIFYDKKPQYPPSRKIKIAGCCGALICSGCGSGGLCSFCKQLIPSIIFIRKTRYEDWNASYRAFMEIESLTMEPFFFEFLRFSNCHLNHRDSCSIRQKLRLYIESQIYPFFLRKVIRFRVSTPKCFIFRTPDDIERYKKMCSVIKSKDFDNIYQNYFRQSEIVMRYSRKYYHSGWIFFIALKLSTMLFPDVNAIRRIVNRITKK